ncbi:hypothetical protein AVEN_18685-1 [Araneus ventricosus]|uniref:Uncharacterized protein n=1 Tax=Araneus ventricosus TaxID=182803 RepID=A0A4Y2ICE0_ARAVE|nr:hypothetical protein AVEN_18685-1 [Araneus ventricosus]
MDLSATSQGGRLIPSAPGSFTRRISDRMGLEPASFGPEAEIMPTEKMPSKSIANYLYDTTAQQKVCVQYPTVIKTLHASNNFYDTNRMSAQGFNCAKSTYTVDLFSNLGPSGFEVETSPPDHCSPNSERK